MLIVLSIIFCFFGYCFYRWIKAIKDSNLNDMWTWCLLINGSAVMLNLINLLRKAVG